MNSFLRALRLTLRYRFTLAGLLCCSFMVALFWGANISALYPIIEVAFQGRSLQDWVAREIDKAETKSAELTRQLEALEAGVPGAPPPDPREQDVLRARLRAEQAALRTARWLKPWIDTYLPRDPFHTITWIVALLLVATMVKSFFFFGDHMLVERLASMVAFDLRKQLYHHTLRMDLHEFGEERTGAMISRFNVDLTYLSQGISALFGRALREPLKGVVCLVGAAFICWRLLLFSLLLTPLAAFLIRALARSIKRANRRALEENAQMMGVLSEAFAGMQTVKAFTMEKYERSRFHRTSKACLAKAMKITFYNALAKPATEILGMTVVFVALVAGAYLVLEQETQLLGIPMCDRPLSVAALLCFFGLLIGASDPARKLSDVLNGLQAAMAAAERIFPLLDREPAIADPPHPQPVPQPHRRLVFDHVSFHYTPEQPVLCDLDLVIPQGETLCIVGSNGCGKTTLVNLLPRFHDPVSGSVRLDDVDLRDVRLRDLRRVVGLVTQQTLLFDDTVYNNIRYGSLNATRDQVIAAAQQAHAHRFIEEQLDGGYDMVVGPGGNRLSGGQRQRLALARVILRDPDILVLDEATSQIDIESEQLIHRALEKFVRDRTAIIITHRLSTLQLAHRILVMDSGRVVDVGTHEQLLRRCELYRRLHEIQFRHSA